MPLKCNYTNPCLPLITHIAHILILNMLKHCVCPCHNTVTKYLHTTTVYSILSYLYLDSRQAKSNHILINTIITYRCHRPLLWLQQRLSNLSLFLYLKAAILFSPASTKTIIFGVILPKCSYKDLFYHLFTPFPFYALLTPDFPCFFALS